MIATQNDQAADFQMKKNNAFKQILGAHAIKFEGLSKTEYKPWKEALQRGVIGLDLDAHQWPDLLRVRTSGEALQPTVVIQQESSAAVGNA